MITEPGHHADPDAGRYVDALLNDATAPREVRTQRDIALEHVYRVRCPQCGELPDSPYEAMADARTARRNHWTDHRDERI